MDKAIKKFIPTAPLLGLLFFAACFLFCFSSSALAATCPEGQVCLNVPIGPYGGEKGLDLKNAFGAYFTVWFEFILGTVGIIAAVVIMYAGLRWLASRGNAQEISDAKDRIFSAVIGLILAFLAYTILNLVNPSLTTIKTPAIPGVQTVNLSILETPAMEMATNFVADFNQGIQAQCSADNIACDITTQNTRSILDSNGNEIGSAFEIHANAEFNRMIEEMGQRIFDEVPMAEASKGCNSGKHCFYYKEVYYFWNNGGYWDAVRRW